MSLLKSVPTLLQHVSRRLRGRGYMRLPMGAAMLLCAILAALPAHAAEHIISFDATIEVTPSSDVVVNEKITVLSEGREIRRGIFRDIPLEYRDRRGNRRSATIDVLNVYRNGSQEPYTVERQGNGVRIRIGQADQLLEPGSHEYEIRYRSGRQLGFFDEFDEIYWNVTGTGWAFPIEEVRARVLVPKGANITSTAAYTGLEGQSGEDYRIAAQGGDSVTYETTQVLQPGEGLTVAVSWPKGFVNEPAASEKAARFLGDNGPTLAGLIGLPLLLAYFYVMWRRVGRDPTGGPIVALYDPPEGLSPAACRYIERIGFDRTTFTAAIVSLAVKGAIRIEESESQFTLERMPFDKSEHLSGGERAVMAKLFAQDRDRLILKNKNHKMLQKAQRALKTHLDSEYDTTYFRHNRLYFLPGLAIALATMAAMALLSPEPFVPLFLTFWTAIWSVGCYVLVTRVFTVWAGVRGAGSPGRRVTSTLGAVFITLFALPFLAGLGFGLFMLATFLSWIAGAILLAIIVTCILFYQWMKAPTRLGRDILDGIEGFRLYLAVAEKDRMAFHNPPERTPELFEKFLPYALALGVEHEWSHQFDSVLKTASLGPDEQSYRPRWYHGSGYRPGSFSSLGSRLSSGLGAAVATASVAPASRSSGSGSFGGGSVGGGGGGGGGGGW